MKTPAPRLALIFALVSILLFSFACSLNDIFDERGVDPGREVELPPDFPTEEQVTREGGGIPATLTPTPKNENSSELPLTECLAPKDAYTWSHENVQVNSGDANRACSADLILVNTGRERLAITLHEVSDNGAMSSNQWKHYRLEPGAQIQKHISQAEYSDGTVTYTLVKNLLVTWDTPACAWVNSEDNLSIWEDRSQQVDLPCN